MSKVHPDDESNTKRQLKKSNPVEEGQTWLRHNVEKQSGMIDLMILEGKNTIEDMAKKLMSKSEFKSKSINAWRKRVHEHIEHLGTTEGDVRNRAWGPGGHNLNVIITDNGIVKFNY